MEDKQFTQLEKDIGKVESKVDNHIEIYRSNGKEIARNNQLIKDHIKMDKERWELIEPALKSYKQQDEVWEQIKPMIRDYKTIINGGKMIRGLAYFILAVGIIGTFLYKIIK